MDVSAVADPDTGVAVYCSDSHDGGWQTGGGTSAAAAVVTGIFSVLNISATASFAWRNPSTFFDVTTGSNKWKCSLRVTCVLPKWVMMAPLAGVRPMARRSSVWSHRRGRSMVSAVVHRRYAYGKWRP